jgi:hypothetical protein
MIRWTLVLFSVLSLSACATDYRGYDRGYDRGYGHTYVESTYGGGGSYYADPYRGRGDYYYGVAASSYRYPLWVDNPYYYSLFWPLQRSFHDPFWHPGFYYGVTYFPRNYFSVSLYGGHRSRYYSSFSSFAYSPYRLAWVDHYYDWYPHYRYYPSYVSGRYAPRFGNARHEAERLSHWGRGSRSAGYDGGLIADRSRYEQRAPRNPERDADYHGRSSARVDPGVRGFNREADLRRQGDYAESRADGWQARGDSERRAVDRDGAWSRDAQARGGSARIEQTQRGGREDWRAEREDWRAEREASRGERQGVRGEAEAWRAERSAQGFASIDRERAERAPVARGDYRRADVDRVERHSPRDVDAPADRGWQRVERGSYARAQSAQPQGYERPVVRGGEREYYQDVRRADSARGDYRVDARSPRAESRPDVYARSAPAPQQWAPEPRGYAPRPAAVAPRGEVFVGGDPRAAAMAPRAQYAPAQPAYQAPPRAAVAEREAPVRGEGRSARGDERGRRGASDEDHPRRH